MMRVARPTSDGPGGRWLLVSDVDDTLLGDDEALSRLLSALDEAGTVLLALNSSRPLASVRQTLDSLGSTQTLAPVALIGAMGTEMPP